MITTDERFLTNVGSKYSIDESLPLRLQKRALLRALGFPSDPELKGCQSCKTNEVARLFRQYSERGYPFLMIVSEKPMLTLVPPLFVVNSANSVQWRDDQGKRYVIRPIEALSIIKRYSKTTWIEFSPNLWGDATIAGRLIYVAMDNQVLEIQQGTVPAKLINDRQLPTYVGDLSFLDLERDRYLEDSHRLRDAGYGNVCSLSMVRSICRKMPAMASFEELRLISRLPTVEFALTKTGQLITVDVDWPAQYIEKKGEKKP